MQASMRAASWIMAKTGRKGLESAVLQRLPKRFVRSVGFQPVWGQCIWPCGYRSQSWFKSGPALAHSAFREISTGSVRGVDECVLQGLRDEIRRLKAANQDREFEPPEPFVLLEKPGCTDVLLQREYDEEKIYVKCELLLQPQDEGDEDENVQNDSTKSPYALLINLTITITKGGSEALEISCQCRGDEYFINYISFHEDLSKEGHDHAVHEKQLSEDLKREFLFSLFLRGLDDEMAVFLHQYCEKKRNGERITNLEKIAAILAEHTL